MATRAEEIRTRQAVIADDLAKLEKAEETEENALRFEVLTTEWDTLDEELKPLAEREKKLAGIRTRMEEEAANREESFVAPDRSGAPRSTRNDPFREIPDRISMLGSHEMHTRADATLKMYEPDLPKEGTELVGRMLSWDPTNSTAEFVLATGAPAYRSAFEKWMRDPLTGPNTWTEVEASAYQRTYAARTAMSLTVGNGGYLVPLTLDPTIILTNSGDMNPYRANATVKTTSTNDWNGVTSAGVNAEWTSENTEAADASPADFAQLKITPQKADAYVFGSYEVLADSDFSTQFPTLLADAKDRLEEAAFSIGTGTPPVPKGVIPSGTVTNAASGLVIHIADVYALQNALPARWRGSRSTNVWLAALPTINSLRQLAKFSGSTSSMVDDTGSVPTMLGKPLLESSSIVTTLTNGSKVLAYLDAKTFFIVDRIGMSMIYDPLVLGANRRPQGSGAYYAFWRTGSNASVAAAIRVLSITT
jgi:HK97 family phage major capsid protein